MTSIKNFKTAMTLASALMLSHCSSMNNRNPAALMDTVLTDITRNISASSNSVASDPSSCAKDMRGHYDRLFSLVGSSVYVEMDNLDILDRDITTSFETRLEMKESLRNFSINSPESKECFAAMTDVFRALRYIEDYMIEIRMEKTDNAPTEFTSMKGSFPYLLVNPKYKDEVKSFEDFKSGDVILSRGNAFSSAAIARIGDSDFQFSHLSFVFRNPLENNKMYTTEAHIEIGAVTAPFEEHLNEKNARSAVFRFNDSKMAADASEYMFNRVKTKTATGRNFDYDFGMNYKDDSKLFCSEIISSGFHHVDPNNDYIPQFKSHFTKGMIPFLNNIGVPVTLENVNSLDVFSPGDIQLDPRFDLIMEWRNPKKMEESRIKDFILTKLFEKMEKENYAFDTTLKMDIQGKSFWLLRRIPIVKKFLEKKFPLNMNPTQMEIFMVLDKVGDILYKEIEKKSVESDHPLTPKEIYGYLDSFLNSDKEAFMKKQPSVLYRYFHP